MRPRHGVMRRHTTRPVHGIANYNADNSHSARSRCSRWCRRSRDSVCTRSSSTRRKRAGQARQDSAGAPLLLSQTCNGQCCRVISDSQPTRPLQVQGSKRGCSQSESASESDRVSRWPRKLRLTVDNSTDRAKSRIRLPGPAI